MEKIDEIDYDHQAEMGEGVLFSPAAFEDNTPRRPAQITRFADLLHEAGRFHEADEILDLYDSFNTRLERYTREFGLG